jgi:hypothetical protein
MPTQEQLVKLPRWAQEHIELLTRGLKEMTASRDEVFALYNGDKSSAVKITNPNIYLPEGATISFTLDNGEEISVGFDFGQKDFDKSGIKVRSIWHRMEILPEAANSVRISSKR